MKTLQLIDRLLGVRKTGPATWIARCPAHDDKSPSITVTEVEDRILIHCFAGCDVHSIVAAVGMEITDLFPDRLEPHGQLKRRFLPSDTIQCLSKEIFFLIMCAGDLEKGEKLTAADMARLRLAQNRFSAAAKAAGL